MSPGSFEAALRAVGGVVHAVDEVMAGKARNAFVATRPARPPRRNGAADGVLLFQQRGHRGAPRPEKARHRACRRGRLRRTPRQRLAGDFLVRPYGHVWLDPPDAALSRHRSGERARRHNTIVNAPLRPGDSGEHFAPRSRA